MAIKKVKPHITLGIITFVLDICTIILGTALVFKDIDGLIYGVVVTYLMAMVMDRIMYGIDEGKMTLIVTDKGAEIAEQIDCLLRKRIYNLKRNRKLFKERQRCS